MGDGDLEKDSPVDLLAYLESVLFLSEGFAVSNN
jgi:hypothetical protein